MIYFTTEIWFKQSNQAKTNYEKKIKKSPFVQQKEKSFNQKMHVAEETPTLCESKCMSLFSYTDTAVFTDVQIFGYIHIHTLSIAYMFTAFI